MSTASVAFVKHQHISNIKHHSSYRIVSDSLWLGRFHVLIDSTHWVQRMILKKVHVQLVTNIDTSAFFFKCIGFTERKDF